MVKSGAFEPQPMNDESTRSITVLSIETNKRTRWRDQPGAVTELSRRSADPDLPGMHLLSVDGLERAEKHLRQDRIDAVLLESGDKYEITRLDACCADQPILVVADEPDMDAARSAIQAGAQDVLLPEDLLAPDLKRRVDLAIARKSLELGRIRHARMDALTGLANTTLLEERFTRATARADRFATLIGLVAIDLDGFDGLIADHGQNGAERLLAMVAQRLLHQTRKTDTLARTRPHGFTWLVEGLAAIDDINALVDRMPKQLAEPFSVDGQAIKVTASVGVAICPFHGSDFQTVHAMAEAAMLDVATISGDGLLMLPIRSAALT